jgi:hypothetical protein
MPTTKRSSTRPVSRPVMDDRLDTPAPKQPKLKKPATVPADEP